MEINKFTEKSKEIISRSKEITANNMNSEIRDLHVMLAFLEDNEGIVKRLLDIMGVNTNILTNDVQEPINVLPKIQGEVSILFSTEVRKALENAEKHAKTMKDDYISVEHIMLGLIDSASDTLKNILKAHKINKNSFLEALKNIRGNVRVQTDTPEGTYDVLNRFGKNITELARQNRLNPVIGREAEIRNVIRILSRRTKNNPVLIGRAGVGKTAIVEGLAQRIIRGDVPTSLKGKIIFELDLGLLVAGAKYKGEFEERLTSVLKEIDKSEGNIILFIDEIHNIVGAGRSDGAMDASNLLKPRLASGELHCMGATTLDEYRKYIEKDPALVRRFQQVMVHEPSVEDTITILRGIQEKFEIFHGVEIQDRALIAAATLSDRYITERYLPDKAIDLVDEACAMIRTEVESMPTEVDDIARKIIQLEIEEKSLEREDNASSLKRLEEVREEIKKLKNEFQNMKLKWEEEKGGIEKIQRLKFEIDEVNAQIAEAERTYDLNKAAELKYSTLPNLKQLLEEAEKKEANRKNKKTLLRNKVTEEEITKVIAKLTGIPVEKIEEGERKKLLHLEETLSERVIGQEEAVEKVSEAILRARAGIANHNRPIGSFLFLGPTGVGKTELAKTLATTLFDDEKNMIRIDMSEYMEKFSVTRLIGAPPGYVGYEQGGQLTEAVRRRPYSVILFDEVEKAHPDVFNVLLQILDDGRVTDSQGRTVDFKNTIIILTSNLGASYILDSIVTNKEITEAVRENIDKLLKQHFKPEFLNRLDEIICFNALQKEVIIKIAKKVLKDLAERLKEKRIDLTFTDAAIDWLIEEGYSIEFGARPLKRAVQKNVENLLAKKIIAMDIIEGDSVEIDYATGAEEIVVKVNEHNDNRKGNEDKKDNQDDEIVLIDLQ